MKHLFLILLLPLLFSCDNKSEKKKTTPKEAVVKDENAIETGWEEAMSAIVKIDSFDGTRILESGQGFFVDDDIIATRFSIVNQADNVIITPLNSDKQYKVTQYVGIDRINDIVLLKTESLKQKPVKLLNNEPVEGIKTIYLSSTPGKNIQLFSGKLFNRTTVKGSKLHRISNKIRKSIYGTPIFTESREVIGIAYADIVNYETQSLVIPSTYLARLLNEKMNQSKSLKELSAGTSEQLAAQNSRIKGVVLETDMGNITIKLFNETPEYRDNFLKLARENFYDSLLFHRVIANFGIQTGAADTRYAEPGDMVGWKGPGYTLPAHIVPSLFHKRGMIGSPRKPDTENQRRRADGSQFYIVSGRRYFDKELDQLENENDYKFTAEQRQVYQTIGGAPHLDGNYTVFGQVISGMDVVDKIVAVETNDEWRPLKDIRLKKVQILE